MEMKEFFHLKKCLNYMIKTIHKKTNILLFFLFALGFCCCFNEEWLLHLMELLFSIYYLIMFLLLEFTYILHTLIESSLWFWNK